MRALQPMEAVLVHRRLDRRHLGDLVPERLGIDAVEVMAAAAAPRRLALDDVPEPFGRDQRPAVTAMAGLPAPLPTRGGGRRPALDRGRVGRGGLGGVGGVELEPGLEVTNALLQLGDLMPHHVPGGQEGSLCVRGDGVPEWSRDGRLWAHAENTTKSLYKQFDP